MYLQIVNCFKPDLSYKSLSNDVVEFTLCKKTTNSVLSSKVISTKLIVSVRSLPLAVRT